MRPCWEQWLDQPVGVTLTTIRRPQRGQYRGGSNALASRHPSWPVPGAPAPGAAGWPQWSQKAGLSSIGG